jgi:hypothetical protein
MITILRMETLGQSGGWVGRHANLARLMGEAGLDPQLTNRPMGASTVGQLSVERGDCQLSGPMGASTADAGAPPDGLAGEPSPGGDAASDR